MPSFDLGFSDDRHDSTSRSFPENLGSGSIPETPKVVPSVAHVHWVLFSDSRICRIALFCLVLMSANS